jgi:hypothetical protein
MSRGFSGNAAHDSTVNTAENTLQAAVVAAAGSQSAIRTAEITFHRAVVKSALANNVSPSAAMSCLRELGVSGL